MKLLVCIDIDGTISDSAWRNIIAGKEPSRKCWKTYKKWLRRVQSKKMLLQDKPVPGMREMCLLMQKHAVYITARQETYRDVTKKWLKKNGFPLLHLYMRGNKNKLSAGQYKENVILSLLDKSKKFVHVVVIDDDPKKDIALAAKKNGWTMLKALSGS